MAFNIVAPAYYICQARLPNLWSLTFFMRDFFTPNLKMLFAAHHCVYKSKDIHEIASVVNIKVDMVEQWMQSFDWLEALGYWGTRPKAGDLRAAERCWTDMIENSEDLYPIDYPDVPKSLSHSQETLEVSTLIKSHLFCVDNLTEDEIQERLANEDNDGMKPAPYREQDLENAYYWWIFPNVSEGLYSKVLARANVVGDLVIDFAGETCLACIRYGRFTLTRQIADDVASIHDNRLLVCL